MKGPMVWIPAYDLKSFTISSVMIRRSLVASTVRAGWGAGGIVISSTANKFKQIYNK